MPTFSEVKAILDRLVTGKTAYLRDTHGDSFRRTSCESLLAARVDIPSGVYRLIDPQLIGNQRGQDTFLIKALRNPNGVDGNGRMPFAGNINGDYPSAEDIATITQWINSGCPE